MTWTLGGPKWTVKGFDGRERRYQTALEEDIGTVRQMEARVREAVGPWLASKAAWDLYVTLTYDQRRQGVQASSGAKQAVAPSSWASRRHVELWLAQVESELGRSIGAAMALEAQGNGWPHWHGLVSAGGVGAGEFAAISALWFKRRGFARFERVDREDPVRMGAYVGKYLTKGYGDLVCVGLREGGGVVGQQLLPLVPSRLEAGVAALAAYSDSEVG